MTAHEFLDKEYFYLILDSRDTNIYSEDIGKAMADFARYKCKELLEIVIEKAKVENECYPIIPNSIESIIYTHNEGSFFINKDSILNAVDLETFCS